LLGTGAERRGGSYTPADIAGWLAIADPLGIELVPEIDLPAHSFAALAAMPELRDPADTGSAVSVQGFADNVLNPGVAATMPFLETVLGEVADLFPGPWIHVGGDEVPEGAWLGSPAALRFATARGVEGTRGIEAAFMRDVIGVVRGLGRQVGVWQEAAECGALQPGEGYAIGWTSNEVNRRLAAAGHDVVAAPAQAYYLDMADDPDWSAPGAFWAGVTTPATVAAFDPTEGWTAQERTRLRGVQACLWSEHVHDETILRRLLLPRLAVFADRAWAPAP
jgi:hexosaminidase